MKSLLAAGLIFMLALLAYSGSFKAQFHFDDYNQVVENPYIRDTGNIPRFFTNASLGSDWSAYFGLKGYRPVTYASFAVNYALSGYRVSGYHIFNFLLHFINAFLVYRVVRSVLRASGEKEHFLVPLFASVVFALHPVQTNAVTYVSGRAGMLAGLFCLLGFLCFLRFRNDRAGTASRYASAFAAPLMYLLGLMSKETAVSLPALMVAYDLIVTVPRSGGFRKSWRTWLCYTPFAAVLLVYLSVKGALQGYVALPGLPFGVHEYLMSEAKVLLLYVRLLVLPFNQNADYNLPLTRSADGLVVISALFLSMVLYFLYRLRRHSPSAAFFGLWFFIALAPESTFVPILDVAVEYRLYLPSAGFIAASAILIAGRTERLARARRVLAAAAVLMLAVLSFSRNEVWANGTALWTDVARKAPYSDRAHANLGKALLDEGRYADAAGEFEFFLQHPHSKGALYLVLNNLGACYKEMGKLDEAAGAFKSAVELFPEFSDAYANLGAAYIQMGREEEAAEAIRNAVRFKPSSKVER